MALIEATQPKDKTVENIAKFEVGKTYFCQFLGDSDIYLTVKILSRTEKMVTALMDDQVKKFKIKVMQYNNTESFKPLGTYSLAPTITALKVVS